MSRVYVGNLEPRVSERDLEDDFRVYGVIRSIWVARRPPGYAFIDFEDHRDADDAIREMDGKHGWRVEQSRKGAGGGRGGGGGVRGRDGGGSGGRGRDNYGGGSDMKCYECGEPGHFARECRLRIGSGGQGSGRRRSPSPRQRKSPSPRQRKSPSPRYRKSPSYGRRSYSPRDQSPSRRSLSPSRRSLSPSRRSLSPSRRSLSPRRDRSYSRSPPYPNGTDAGNGNRRSRSRS